MRECARLGTTQLSLEVAAGTLERLGRVGISGSTVWRYHKVVTGQLEKEMEEEQKLPPHVRQEDVSAMEWVTAHERIDKHASVSIDGMKVLLRDEGYREVKIVSVSEVMEETKEEAEAGTKTARRCDEDSVVENGQGAGCQKGVKPKRYSYRAILGDKATFIPTLKGELACRRVRQATIIWLAGIGICWTWAKPGTPGWSRLASLWRSLALTLKTVPDGCVQTSSHRLVGRPADCSIRCPLIARIGPAL